MTSAAVIRVALPSDAAVCAEIFAHYALNTDATLREEPMSPTYFAELIDKASDDSPFVTAVYQNDNNVEQVIGYAYSDLWRTRCGYQQTTEVSVYVDKAYLGKGAGNKLLTALLQQLQRGKMQAAVSLITMPNPSSVKLHEKFGFEASGVLRGVGRKFNTIRDVGIWVKRLR